MTTDETRNEAEARTCSYAHLMPVTLAHGTRCVSTGCDHWIITTKGLLKRTRGYCGLGCT